MIKKYISQLFPISNCLLVTQASAFEICEVISVEAQKSHRFIKNILIYVSKIKQSLMGLKWHGGE